MLPLWRPEVRSIRPMVSSQLDFGPCLAEGFCHADRDLVITSVLSAGCLLKNAPSLAAFLGSGLIAVASMAPTVTEMSLAIERRQGPVATGYQRKSVPTLSTSASWNVWRHRDALALEGRVPMHQRSRAGVPRRQVGVFVAGLQPVATKTLAHKALGFEAG